MKYYLIAGEASGDLHASRLMRSLKEKDSEAVFRFFGGDQMAAMGGTLVKHYRELAYMGFVPVLMHLPAILKGMSKCKQDIARWKPDVVILVDYPGFNLDVAKYVKKNNVSPVFYYIAPKIWAWKEYRIKNIRRDVDQLFSILPFEKDFFEGKHRYPIHYVGNPTAGEVAEFRGNHKETFAQFCQRYSLDEKKPIIALLAGSRRQEIKDNLPAMIAAGSSFDGYQMVVAGAPAIGRDYYEPFLSNTSAILIENDTYALLAQAAMALVTSGTATLETALFRVPQVVCYETPLPQLFGWLRRNVLSVDFVSLVNLIAGYEVVPELVAERFSEDSIRQHLSRLMEETERQKMLKGYDLVTQRLGQNDAADRAADIITALLKGNR